VDPNVQNSASRLGLPVIRIPDAEHACHELSSRRPDVVIVQVPPIPDEALVLIEAMTTAPWRMRVIAAAVLHSDAVERAARRAGATCYLPCGELQQLGDVVSALAEQAERDAAPYGDDI
jgi:hypothetical protein